MAIPTPPSTKKLLVIGGSDGIGLHSARALLAEGWQVFGVSRSLAPVDHPAYHQAVVDLSQAGYGEFLAGIVEQHGPFDSCLYCAGIGVELSEDLGKDLKVFEVNLMAAVQTAALLIPPMLRAGRGHFVVLSSQADALISTDHPSYAASKAALSAYFEALGLALRPRGVVVTNIRFGFVDTKMAKAPIRPFIRSVGWAAKIVVAALSRRNIRVTRPRRMVILVWLLRWLTDWRIRLS
jgi:NAD(P)-dependent dehydrogenase (short-subunit alcohol dehydrogenase family)